jgi:hypothetical protein
VIVAVSTVLTAWLTAEQMFPGLLAASAMGYAAHWLLSRHRRPA